LWSSVEVMAMVVFAVLGYAVLEIKDSVEV
jgi:hypothetical protein